MPPGEDEDLVTKYVLNEISELDRKKLESEMLIQKDIFVERKRNQEHCGVD